MSKPFWQKPIFVLGFATAVIVMAYGSRQSFGVFLRPITQEMGWGREGLSLAIASQALIYGIAAPFVGVIADKWGPIKVLITSGTLYCLGFVMMTQSVTEEGFFFSIGLLIGLGSSGCAFPLLLSLVGRVAPEEKRTFWFGIVTSGGTAGQFLLVPLSQGMITNWGWVNAASVLAAMVVLVIPLSWALGRAAGDEFKKKDTETLGEVIRKARGHSGFWLLVTGFYVCGFQVQFINSHLPAYLGDSPVGAMMGAIAISIIGLFNMIGTWVSGWLGGRYRKKYLLSGIYFARSVVILGFISFPLSQTSVVVFAALVGLLWLATVPLTSGIVVQIFGTRYLATLYGVVFLSHQLGSFTSVWLGGKLYDQTGSYDLVWWAIIALGLVAALLHWPIDDQPVERLAQQEG
jgi:predicted MFS family arabinose efflux permease